MLVATALWACLAAVAAAQDSDDRKIPPPEDVNLVTKDRVKLVATWYGGTEGKNTVPIIMVHMEKGNRHDYEALALYLQAQGHAVIVPDLRGHGDSTSVEGSDMKLEVDENMPVFHYQRMAEYDLETVKSFLMNKHHQGELNIDKLCVVGAEMGAVVAMNWAMLDWSWPVLATGKQGQDVKAVVLISPVEKFKNLKMSEALSHPGIKRYVSVYVVMGASDSRAVKEGTQIFKTLDRGRKAPDSPEEQTLFLDKTLKTKLQGTKLLGESALGLEQRLEQFIDFRLVKQTQWPWKDRTSPLQ